jgi:hypothetical protein
MRKNAKKILPGKDVPGMNATHSRRAHPGDSRNRKFFLLKPLTTRTTLTKTPPILNAPRPTSCNFVKFSG